MRAGGALAVVVLLCSAAHASLPPVANTEIGYLLSTLASSDCEFNRNGSWYDANSAAAHLSSKLQYLLAKDLVQSSEEFIDKAATQSSSSGRTYEIRCKGGEAVPTGPWLRLLLARYRESVESQGKLE